MASKIDSLGYKSKLGTNIHSMIEGWMVEGQEYTISSSAPQGEYQSHCTYSFYINYDYFGIPRKYNIIEMTTSHDSDIIDSVSYVFSWVHIDDTYTYARILENIISTIMDSYGDPAYSYMSGGVYNDNATRDDTIRHIIGGNDGLYIVDWDKEGCMLSVDISDSKAYFKGKIAFFAR